MTSVTPAIKLAEAGLVRQAAATSAGALLQSFDGILDDVTRAMPDAFGQTTLTAERHGTKLSVWNGTLDVPALLRGEAGQGVADSIGGALRLLDEAEAFASIADDASLSSLIVRSRSEAQVAHAIVQDTVAQARTRAASVGGLVRDGWRSIDETHASDAVARLASNGPMSSAIGTLLDAARARAAGGRLIAESANVRIAELQHIAEIASAARAAAGRISGAGDQTMQRAEPLANAAGELIGTVRRAHAEGLAGAFSVRDKSLIIDVATLDRHVSTAEAAMREARGLLDEIDVLIGSQEQHLHVRTQLTTARRQAQSLDANLGGWRGLRHALGGTGASTGRVVNGGVETSTGWVRADGVKNQLHLPLGGISLDAVRRAVRKDPAPTIARMVKIGDGPLISAVDELRATIAGHVQGTSANSMLGAGTYAAVDDALAAVRGKYGSAEELRAALAASVGGG